MADRAIRSTIAEAPGALGTLRRRAQGLTGIGVRPGRAWSVARFTLDTAMLVTAGVATTLGSSAVDVPAPSAFWLAVFAAFVLAFCGARGMYRPRLHYELLEDLRVVLVATSLAAMAVLSLRELISAPPDLSAQVIRTWAFATAYVAAGRVALHWSRAQAYRHGESVRPTLIIGAGKVGRLAAKRLLAHPELGL
jgi:FlaA1/EpsC-like NDP-sugar epimerase